MSKLKLWCREGLRGFVAGINDAVELMCKYGWTFFVVFIICVVGFTYGLGAAGIVALATLIGIHIGRKNG